LERRDWRILVQDSALIGLGTFAAYLWTASRHGFGAMASAVALTSIALGEAFYALACTGGSETRERNPALWGSIASVVGLQLAVNHWGPLRRLLRSAPLGGPEYTAALAAACLPVGWALLRAKLWNRDDLPPPVAAVARP
jgi:hypothetical protein